MGYFEDEEMVHLSLTAEDIFSTIAHYQYAVIIPLTALEGPVVVFLTGFLVFLGFLNLWLAFALVMVGDIAGDFMFYFIGKWGRGPLRKGWGKPVGITPENTKEVSGYFSRHSSRTIVVGKLTHVFGAASLIAAGMADFSVWRFALLCFIAGVPKMAGIMALGYFYGELYDRFGIYFTALAVASLVFIPFSFWIFSLSEKIKKFLARR
ncbi:MAG TPA: VTT domain-containing protein [Candidatus Paceibacterota bacterium]|nr:VTT domain-containing protein [Candidatus Paceibacterota bacterium]